MHMSAFRIRFLEFQKLQVLFKLIHKKENSLVIVILFFATAILATKTYHQDLWKHPIAFKEDCTNFLSFCNCTILKILQN